MTKTIKHIVLLVLFVCSSIAVQAQGTMERLKFEEAEQRFQKFDYHGAISLLEELEAKGMKNPKILYLKIIARAPFVRGIGRYDKIFKGHTTAQALRKDCDLYLSRYDIEGLEDKYKEVYQIAQSIQHLPKTQEEWNQAANQMRIHEEQYRRKIISDFCNNVIKVEKGTFYRNTIDRRNYLGEYRTDKEIIDSYKEKARYFNPYYNGNPQRAIEIPYNFYVVNQYITEAIIWAVLDNPNNYYINYHNNYAWDTWEINYLPKKQDFKTRLRISKKNGYPFSPEEERNISYENVLYFIQALNSKTGKKFRLITQAEWQYTQRGGHKQQLDTIVEKQIIGGNKRKGYEYKYINYYSYKSGFIWPCLDQNDRECRKQPNELGIKVKGATCDDRSEAEEYARFTGKAIPETGNGKIITMSGFSLGDNTVSGYDHTIKHYEDKRIKNGERLSFILVSEE
ncbi:outer membrane protein assembly factor BamD [Sinomicrobium soli]|uniref:SUMF1/EgtB/PvdO family nonheme iron enzyme n=1 Tax=Sinomicrobium sp. N-1-3-6 TaxID=2219864 RepID=UPI000DCE69EA|nr:SUMF1/EgtB/PvdO family nonheme iron enzyme [Sinomicrobium sp. N-1-3-6]RAV29037.1 hypothetical protein DN748_08875 [Sinomicrobium sp. N-1-3-6]